VCDILYGKLRTKGVLFWRSLKELLKRFFQYPALVAGVIADGESIVISDLAGDDFSGTPACLPPLTISAYTYRLYVTVWRSG
jgi:hypothetical protein